MNGNSIRPHLMLTLSVLLALTTLMAGFSLFTLWQNQYLLDRVTQTTLADTQTALNLSQGVAQIAALAPYTAASARPHQIQNEKKQLQARAATLNDDALKLTTPSYAHELGQRIGEVDVTLQKLMSNVERELYIREDLMAQQFALDELDAYPFGALFIHAFAKDPTRISQGWIDQITNMLTSDPVANERIAHDVMPVLASLTRSNTHINVLRSENAFLLASIRAQSDRMTDYVREIVAIHQQEVSEQQRLAKSAINRVMLLMAMILLSLVAGVYYLYRFNDKMAKDLLSVTDEMLNLAQGNTQQAPVKLERKDEIGKLATAFSAFQRNAIEKERATQDLFQQNVLLETIFHEMQDGLSAFDADNRLLAWNSKYAFLLGIDENQLAFGMTIEDVQEKLSLRLQSSAEHAQQNETYTSLRHLQPLLFERQFKDGRIIEYRSQPIPSGGFITLYRDLTEKRQIDLALKQAQKMETLGQLTGGIAHDFNNLLSALSGNLELLDMTSTLDDTSRTYLNRALSVTEKGSQLIERLLAFSRTQPLHPEPVNVEQTLDELSDLMEYSLDGTSQLLMHTSPQDALIFADKSGLENALMNLLLNANAAMTQAGRVIVTTRPCCLLHDKKAAVIIEVEDSGSGIHPDDIDKVMEPFFSTKEKGKGSGLGLSMVYGFVEQSKGEIVIDSTVGKGTAISMILPCYEPEHLASTTEKTSMTSLPDATNTTAPAATSTMQALHLEGITILLVDDDNDVALPIKQMLETQGASVTLATSAKEAIKLSEATKPNYVISDINLGNKETGVWLKNTLHVIQPKIPVILMSGLPKEQLSQQFGYQSDWDLITKPVTRHALSAALLRLISIG
ncbi:hybrid sensor histidine kinase/response regulator [Enterovibrio norvegicus FF-33]|uniref:hybrid sensor histidine kinase/response regulator n=1 Tax=Enterovibrio norvegicus TaxID=188144 RepID=UPI00031BB49B|nr:PAS-domain containing protein [Enterovibrio norvegicus]OEE65918.1 hybrid sensor histidine kinase/response regulator [Enterovibrio norvegicus FF-33]OEE74354.1 hybrid sensor histidine kinase/response regulator [Enterovibrio norvegicus FF-162]